MSTLSATRHKLQTLAMIGIGNWAFGTIPFWVNHTQGWLIWMSVVAILGLLLIYAARRGVWVSYWGIFALAGLSALGMTGIYMGIGHLPLESQIILIFGMVLIILIGVAIYLYTWALPRWHAAYSLNTQRKLDLDNGLYSVTRHWADPPGTRLNRGYAFYPWLFIAGPSFVAVTRGLDMNIQIPAVLIGMYVVWFFWSMMASELYVAHQLRKIERQIGRPLLIDAYVDDVPMKAR